MSQDIFAPIPAIDPTLGFPEDAQQNTVALLQAILKELKIMRAIMESEATPGRGIEEEEGEDG